MAGMTLALSVEDVAQLTFELETVLDDVKTETAALSQEPMDDEDKEAVERLKQRRARLERWIEALQVSH